jgi:acyl-CoA thioesterase-1
MNKHIAIIVFSALIIAGGVGWMILGFSASDDSTIRSLSKNGEKGEVVTIIAFGDSLTAGYGLPLSESYPAQLEQVLRNKGYKVTVINSGVSGETTRGNLERATFIRSQNPDIVLLGIGGNDALRVLPLDETRNNMQSTIDILKSGDNPPIIMLLGMQAPLNSGLQYKRQFDALYESLAEDNNLTLIPFITKDIFLDSDNKLADGIHYNQTGYQKVIEQHILPAVEALLD